jgi:hypothetical protein
MQSANAAAQNQQQTVQLNFYGDVYRDGSMKEVIRRINGEVKFCRVQLYASHTITGNVLR